MKKLFRWIYQRLKKTKEIIKKPRCPRCKKAKLATFPAYTHSFRIECRGCGHSWLSMDNPLVSQD